MKIKDIFKNKNTLISFEIFPPKKETSIETIYEAIHSLADLKPDFISVTYGAGGTGSNKTVDIASIIKREHNIEALAHLTCVTSTKSDIENILSNLKANNINNILALRGDIPNNTNLNLSSPLHYEYASDLISHIKSEGDFCIGAACYPECHIECKSIHEDILNLKNKVDLGADFLISQLFFNNEQYYEYLNKLKSLNINVPVSAGIMPVVNIHQIQRMTAMSGASMTDRLIRMLSKYENNPEALKEAGIAYATEQIIDLISLGVDGIHIYTMNKPEIARAIVDNISNIRKCL